MKPARWTADEDQLLRLHWQAGKSDSAIAAIIGRSKHGIQIRRIRVGGMPAQKGAVRGEKHGRSKLSLWDVAMIRRLFDEEEPPPLATVARAFGVTPRAIRAVRLRENWGWL